MLAPELVGSRPRGRVAGAKPACKLNTPLMTRPAVGGLAGDGAGSGAGPWGGDYCPGSMRCGLGFLTISLGLSHKAEADPSQLPRELHRLFFTKEVLPTVH